MRQPPEQMLHSFGMRITTMNKDINAETNSSHPIELDSNQLKKLEELIDDLKKEIVLPRSKKEVNAEPLRSATG